MADIPARTRQSPEKRVRSKTLLIRVLHLFFNGITGSGERHDLCYQGVAVSIYHVGLRGESNYQPAIRRCAIGDQVNLRHEPDNPYDGDAIRAMAVGRGLIGYLPKGGWLTGAILDEGKPVKARIATIGPGATEHLGVVLEVEV